MQIKIKTETLKNITNKVVKGMGNNKMLPITEIIGINIDNNNLCLLSTDGTNKVAVNSQVETTEPTTISLSVNGATFSKLVQKTTTEFTTLKVEDGKLVISANGNYSFPIPVDEEGNFITFEPLTLETENVEEVNVNSLKESYIFNKESVATTNEFPAYTGYYYDDNCSVTTNSLKISSVNAKVFSSPILLFSSFVQLFTLFDSKTVNVKQNDSEILIYDNDVAIKSLKMTEILDFPIADIKPFLNTDMEHKIAVNKQALLNLLERISIFVSPFDNNGIKIDFTKEGLKVWTIKGDNNELLPYTRTDNFAEYTIRIDVINFKALVGSNPEDEVTIHYGNPNAIKMTFGKAVQVVALQENK